MTVGEMMSKMTSLEFSYWIAYYEQNPFGEARADIRHAINTTSIVNCWSKKTYKYKDFMPNFKPQKSSVEDVKEYFIALSKRGKNGK